MDINVIQPHEIACTFGEQCQLAGVYTEAVEDQGDQPCALYLTAGLLHHIGPTRLHVELARSLAMQGISGLRFDLSGVGDSEPGSLGGDFQERSVKEVRQAMDFLQTHHGKQKFVLLGLCSGADDALATAQQDARVAGIVLLNGYAYPAGLFRLYRLLKFYLPRLFVWQKLRNRALMLLRRLRPSTGSAATQATAQAGVEQQTLAELDEDYRYIPPQEETGKILERLCEAETDILFLYTGSEHETYTYEGQLRAMFPSLSGNRQLNERYIQEADHTLLLPEDRDKVILWIADWFRQSAFKRRH